VSEEYWRERCDELIRLLRASHPPLEPGADQRDCPRYPFTVETLVRVSGPPRPYRIQDISAGGVAIFTDHVLEPGTRLMVSVKNSVYVEVEVLGSDIVVSDSDLLDFAYKTRCRFLSEQDGYMAFAVMAGRE
jgi:hypothetical protein